MSQDGVELARYDEAGEAREAARRLLSAGLTPTVRRDATVHVLTVAPAHAVAAAEVLAIDPPLEMAVGEAASGYASSGDWSVPHEAHGEADQADAPGGDEVDDLVVDERGFVLVALADGPDEARAVAARLLDAGIPSEACSAFATGHANPMATVGDPQAVQVLEVDTDRALGVLGAVQLPRRLTPPAATATTGPEPLGGPEATAESAGASPPETRLRRRTEAEEVRPYLGGRVNLTRRQLRTMIALYLAALILLPLAFFLATQWILTPDIERPELPEVPVDAVVPLPMVEGWFTGPGTGRA